MTPTLDRTFPLTAAFDPVLVLDAQGCILNASDAAGQVLGNGLIGQFLAKVLPTVPTQAFEPLLIQVLGSSSPISAELELQDGRVLEARIVPLPSGAAILGATASGAAVHLRDITAFRRTQERSQCLLDLTTQLAGTRSTQQVVQAILERGAGVLRAHAAAAFRLGASWQTLDLIGTVGHPPEFVQAWQHLPLPLALPITDAVRSRRPLVLTAKEAHERYPLLTPIRLLGTQVLVTLPLVFGDRVLGVMTFDFQHDLSFDPQQDSFVQALAQLCAQALERSQLAAAQRTELAERRQAERALMAERARLEAVLDQLPVAVWIGELPSGRLLAGNRAIGSIMRDTFKPADDIEGYRAYSGFHPDGRAYEVHEWPLARTIASGETVVGEEIEILRGDGSRGTVSFNSTLVRGEEGKPLYAVLTGADVTQRRQAEAQVRAWSEDLERQVQGRTAELEAANRELNAFSYSVSHDLRRPVRHIIGFSGLLRRKAQARLEGAEAGLLDTIEGAATTMNAMIDGLLTFARLSGQGLLQTDVNLGELVREARRQLAPDTAERQIDWAVSPLPTVRGDRTLLGFVLVNLLSNAVKYTGTCAQARIEVGADLHGDEVAIWVRDNGVGFDPAYASRLFGVFQRLHKDSEFEGVGIGLANVQRIIARHGGRVWAEGALGQGAIFGFVLPTEQVSEKV